jgi:hypothetical protein
MATTLTVCRFHPIATLHGAEALPEIWRAPRDIMDFFLQLFALKTKTKHDHLLAFFLEPYERTARSL